MNSDSQLETQIETVIENRVNRRNFFKQAGMLGLGAAAAGVALTSNSAEAQSNSQQVTDTTAEILTAFLIAEDLEATMYYNALIGGLITDPKLAGPGGSAKNVTSGGNAGNVAYMRAALYQEFQHGATIRALLTGTSGTTTNDPAQTFYFPNGVFDTLSAFLPFALAIESAGVGAYLNLVQEFAYKAGASGTGGLRGGDTKYTAKQYGLFARIGASILGTESAHRALINDLAGTVPANDYVYQQLDGITAVYTGSKSAAAVLTPYFTSTTPNSTGYSLQTALKNAGQVWLQTGGSLQNT